MNNEEILTVLLKYYTESVPRVEAKLDVVYQLIKSVDDSIIAKNIQTRYKLDGKDCLQNVKSDLEKAGFKSTEIDFFHPLELHSIVTSESDQILSSAVRARITQLDPKWKLVARELALHDYQHLNIFFYRNHNWVNSSFSWSIGANEDEVEKILVQIGLINHGWYKSGQYDNPTWYIPEYVFPLLDNFRQSPERFGVPQVDTEEIRQLMKEPEVVTFVKWLLNKRVGAWNDNLEQYDGLLVTIQDDSELNLWLRNTGSSGPDVIGKLVSKGALTLRPDAGKKCSSPKGRTPDGCEFRLTMPFLEALLKEKYIKVDLIED